jgi:hypothetical protein
VYFRVDPATAGAVSGKVRFAARSRRAFPSKWRRKLSAARRTRASRCNDEPVITAKDGGLASAFVYIKSGLDGKNFEPPKEKVSLDQHGASM